MDIAAILFFTQSTSWRCQPDDVIAATKSCIKRHDMTYSFTRPFTHDVTPTYFSNKISSNFPRASKSPNSQIERDRKHFVKTENEISISIIFLWNLSNFRALWMNGIRSNRSKNSLSVHTHRLHSHPKQLFDCWWALILGSALDFRSMFVQVDVILDKQPRENKRFNSLFNCTSLRNSPK